MTDKHTASDTTSERDAESRKTKVEDLPADAKGKDVKGGGSKPGTGVGGGGTNE
jgi:hypothetical protein